MRVSGRTLVSLTAALLSLAACGSSSSTSSSSSAAASSSGSASSGPATGTPYELGFEADLSANFAANGAGLRSGFEAYFTYLNAHGGVNGHPVNVTVMDDAATTTRGIGDATQLITQQHVSAIAGGLLSNVCGAMEPLAKTNKVPLYCMSVGGNNLNPVDPWIYSSRIAQLDEARPIMTMAESVVTGRKLAIVAFNSAASTSLHNALKKVAAADGWSLVADETVPQTATDVSAQAANIVKANPDIVVGALPDAPSTLFMRTLTSQGASSLDFVDYDGGTTVALEGLKNPHYIVASSITQTDKGSDPQITRYHDILIAQNAKFDGPFVNAGYVQGLALGEALKACGFPCAGSQLQGALDSLNIDAGSVTAGPITLSATNHEAIRNVNFYAWDASSSSITLLKGPLPGGAS